MIQLHAKCKTMKLLEDYIGEKLGELELYYHFIDTTSKRTIHVRNISKLAFITIKTAAVQRIQDEKTNQKLGVNLYETCIW